MFSLLLMASFSTSYICPAHVCTHFAACLLIPAQLRGHHTIGEEEEEKKQDDNKEEVSKYSHPCGSDQGEKERKRGVI